MSSEDDADLTHDQEALEGATLPKAPGPLRARRAGSDRFAPGTMVANRFRIVNLVGAGGMGQVYRAEDMRLGQTVALKFVDRALANDGRVLSMLHREVRLGREISHPNVARLYDVFDWETTTFVSMEFIDGEDLSSLLRRIGRLPHDKGVEIARGITRGLMAAHERGVLHRDLKPANIMIDGRGEPRITDFGLAIAGDEQHVGSAGTPAYMAPEQFLGTPATIQSDLYALGLVLHEIFTGHRVRSGRSVAELLREHADPPSAPSLLQPDIDPLVERIILQCLASDPSDRPRSAGDVLHALPGRDRLAAAVAAGETPSPDALVGAEITGRVSGMTAALLVGGIVVLAGILLLLKQQLSPPALVDWTRPPEVLRDRARGLIDAPGASPPVFEHLEMQTAPEILPWVSATDTSLHRWQTLDRLPLYTVRWTAFHEPLSPEDPTSLTPAFSSPAAEVELDLQGRLRSLILRETSTAHSIEELTALTTMDELRVATPSLSPPIDIDQHLAWTGRRPDMTADERLEVGLKNGSPVWLEVRGPWSVEGPGAEVEIPFATRSLAVFMIVMGAAILALAAVMAWRNLKNGRGDKAGAVRIAVAVVAVESVAALIGSSYPPWLGDRIWIVRGAVMEALYSGALMLVLYLALEPMMRRVWPQLLVSWRRLIAGRWRDELVGRDVLIGIGAGLAHGVLALITWRVGAVSGEPPETPGLVAMSALLSPRNALEFVGASVARAVFFALAFVFVLVMFAALTRRRWAAMVLLLLLMNIAFYFAVGEFRMISVVVAVLLIGTIAGYGLLAAVAMQMTFFITFHYPLLFDSSQWFFWTAAFPLVILAVATWLACSSALGYRPSVAPGA